MLDVQPLVLPSNLLALNFLRISRTTAFRSSPRSDLADHGVREIGRGGRPAEIRCPKTTRGDDPFHRADDAVVQIPVPQVVEHHRASPDRANRVRDALARD